MIHAGMSFDGGVRGGNPGHAGFAAVIIIAGKMHTIARPIPGLNTNNYAEYMGLIVGAKYASHLGADEIDITSDSKLVVEQVNGRWECKNHDMRLLCSEAQDLLEKLFPGSWTLGWLPRLSNVVADAACAQAVRCAMNPWLINRLDPFGVSKLRVKTSRAPTPATHARTRT
jgi:ribonuclease H / adenosylcobalamin/alpha-ribazole phosphatase